MNNPFVLNLNRIKIHRAAEQLPCRQAKCVEVMTNVEDRHRWRKIVHDAANPRIEDG